MFRFSIRDVLWLTVLTALVATWGIDHCRLSQRIKVLEPKAKANWVPLVSPPFSGFGTFGEFGTTAVHSD